MEIRLQTSKSVEENAEIYFERAKKLKKKVPGIKKTIEMYKDRLEKAESDAMAVKKKLAEPKQKKEWFERFRWFISSDDFLVIGGRDATTNDMIIKKYTDKDDIVFHTDEPGSPFVVVKNVDGKKIPEKTITESAELCASFSRQWRAERSVAEVYWVNPDQVSKEAKSGESIAKGAFMIYGKRNYITAKLNLAVCNIGRIMTGPVLAVKRQCEDKGLRYIEVVQGDDKLSDVAKKIHRAIDGDLDEIIRNLPQGCSIKK